MFIVQTTQNVLYGLSFVHSSNSFRLHSSLHPFSLNIMITLLEICLYMQVRSSVLKMEVACSSETSATAHTPAEFHNLNDHDLSQWDQHCSGQWQRGVFHHRCPTQNNLVSNMKLYSIYSIVTSSWLAEAGLTHAIPHMSDRWIQASWFTV